MDDLTENQKKLIALGGHFGRRAAEEAVTGVHPCRRDIPLKHLRVAGCAGSVTIRIPDSDEDSGWDLKWRQRPSGSSGSDGVRPPSSVPVAFKTHGPSGFE